MRLRPRAAMIRLFVTAAVVALCGCAAGPDAAGPAGAPNVRIRPGTPAPPQARLYADCIAEAVEAGAYVREPESEGLRFTCTGETAKGFYDGLGPWAASQGAEYSSEGRSWRFSVKLEKNADGIDNCSTDGAGDYRCHVILRIGEFIEQMDYRIPAQ
jgi:hypothetical protein